MKSINIILPIYNEERNIPVLCDEIKSSINDLDYEFELTFVDDGSNDNSWNEIKNVVIDSVKIKKIKLSRNFGHQSAIFCWFK